MSRKPEWTEWKWDVGPTPAVLPPDIQEHVDTEYATDPMGAHLDLCKADELRWDGAVLYARCGSTERAFALKLDSRTGQQYFFEV